QFEAEAMAGQSNDAHSVDWTVDARGKACKQRIAFGCAAEKPDIDAFDVILVDQHSSVAAALEQARQPQWRVAVGWNDGAHIDRANPLDRPRDGVQVGRSENHRGCEAVGRADQGRKLPVAEMRSEDQCALAVVAKLEEAKDRWLID